MPGWLLSKEVFVDLLAGRAISANPVLEWAKTKGNAEFFVSELTWASVRADAEQSAELTAEARRRWTDELDEAVPRKFGGRLLPVSRKDLVRWSLISQTPVDSQGLSAPTLESIEVAVALENGFVLAIRDSQLAAQVGCPMESPWP